MNLCRYALCPMPYAAMPYAAMNLPTQRYSRGLTHSRDRRIRFIASSFAEHLDDAGGDEGVEEVLAIDVGRQHFFGTVAERAEDVVGFGVFGADGTIEIFFQR